MVSRAAGAGYFVGLTVFMHAGSKVMELDFQRRVFGTHVAGKHGG